MRMGKPMILEQGRPKSIQHSAVGSGLICLIRLLSLLALLLWNAHPMHALDRAFVRADIGRRGCEFCPFKVQSLVNVKTSLTKLCPSKGTTENIPVAHISIDRECFRSVNDGLSIGNLHRLSSKPFHFWQRERLASRNNLLLQRNATPFLLSIYRNFGQFFAGIAKGPPLQERWRLSPIPYRDLEF